MYFYTNTYMNAIITGKKKMPWIWNRKGREIGREGLVQKRKWENILLHHNLKNKITKHEFSCYHLLINLHFKIIFYFLILNNTVCMLKRKYFELTLLKQILLHFYLFILCAFEWRMCCYASVYIKEQLVSVGSLLQGIKMVVRFVGMPGSVWSHFLEVFRIHINHSSYVMIRLCCGSYYEFLDCDGCVLIAILQSTEWKIKLREIQFLLIF